MLDGRIDPDFAKILRPAPRETHRRTTPRPLADSREDSHEDTRSSGHTANAADLWRAPLHLSFSFGLFVATRLFSVR